MIDGLRRKNGEIKSYEEAKCQDEGEFGHGTEFGFFKVTKRRGEGCPSVTTWPG